MSEPNAETIYKEFEGAITEISANKTLNPKDDFNRGFNAGCDEAIKFIRHYIAKEGLFQI
jgi:hypothetical protein